MLPIIQSKFDEDEKYAKSNGKTKQASPGAFSKYHDAFHAARTAGQPIVALLGRGFAAYVCFLLVCASAYKVFGGRFHATGVMIFIGWTSTVTESLGLLVLRQKIVTDKSVAGISKMTMQIYAFVYLFREAILCPHLNAKYLDEWMVEWLCIPSIIMVFATLHSFKTYRSTYQEDMDVLKAKYVLPACLVMAFLIHPDVKKGTALNIVWTVILYADTVALMPQVVMMARGTGKVAAPIAHFVAATALSRCVDLSFWYWGTNLIGFWSVVLIVLMHLTCLLLIADFMYYYLKARFGGSSVTEDLVVDTCDNI